MVRRIKKYKNRRLYDTEVSRYITIEELQHYVTEGTPFKVEDSLTGKDITNAILLQILVEMESGATQFLSPEMLQQLIRFATHPMSQSFKSSVEQLFSTMQNTLGSYPYVDDYKKATRLWNEKTQAMFKQWQDFLKP